MDEAVADPAASAGDDHVFHARVFFPDSAISTERPFSATGLTRPVVPDHEERDVVVGDLAGAERANVHQQVREKLLRRSGASARCCSIDASSRSSMYSSPAAFSASVTPSLNATMKSPGCS